MSLAIVIPCHNEAETVGSLVRALSRKGRVIIVDDGSTDATMERAEDAGALVVRHNHCRGIARAIRTGWAAAGDVDRVAVIDAGGSHDPTELSRLLAVDADLVIGSRFVFGGQYVGGHWWRRLGSRLAALACWLAQGGHRLHDWTSGYRIYSRRAIGLLQFRCYSATMHAWQIESLGWARRMGLTIAEVPISYRAGQSSMRWLTVREALVVWWRLVGNGR